MSEPHERLQRARKAAGFTKPADAASALGVSKPTYYAHENGSRPLLRSAQRYARFFRVSLDWLVDNRGEMRPSRVQPSAEIEIEIDGLVGAGGAVQVVGDPAEPAGVASIPTGPEVGALVVRGDSQWPRFLDGETVLYDRRPVLPQALVGYYAVVQTPDGRRMLKILKRGRRENFWTLTSHNAPDEEDVRLIGAWRYIGVLAADGGRAR